LYLLAQQLSMPGHKTLKYCRNAVFTNGVKAAFSREKSPGRAFSKADEVDRPPDTLYNEGSKSIKGFCCGKIEFRGFCGFGERGRKGVHASLYH
jgi:hypothetical protein